MHVNFIEMTKVDNKWYTKAKAKLKLEFGREKTKREC
jgi:hypothetical protein